VARDTWRSRGNTDEAESTFLFFLFFLFILFLFFLFFPPLFTRSLPLPE
jgi:hypothetical protein